MNTLYRDFVSYEPREFRFKIGAIIASSLAGFVAGVVFTAIISTVIFNILALLGLASFGN